MPYLFLTYYSIHQQILQAPTLKLYADVNN